MGMFDSDAEEAPVTETKKPVTRDWSKENPNDVITEIKARAIAKGQGINPPEKDAAPLTEPQVTTKTEPSPGPVNFDDEPTKVETPAAKRGRKKKEEAPAVSMAPSNADIAAMYRQIATVFGSLADAFEGGR